MEKERDEDLKKGRTEFGIFSRILIAVLIKAEVT